jgi:hypothetical protein
MPDHFASFNVEITEALPFWDGQFKYTGNNSTIDWGAADV